MTKSFYRKLYTSPVVSKNDLYDDLFLPEGTPEGSNTLGGGGGWQRGLEPSLHDRPRPAPPEYTHTRCIGTTGMRRAFNGNRMLGSLKSMQPANKSPGSDG